MCLAFLILYVYLFLFSNNLPNACCNGCTCEWTYDEHPKVANSLTTFEDSWTDGTSRIDRCARVVDTHEVDENE